MPLRVNTLVKPDIKDDGCCIEHFDMNGSDGSNAIFEFGCVGVITEISKVSHKYSTVEQMYYNHQLGWEERDIRVKWIHTCPNHKQYNYLVGLDRKAWEQGTWHDADYLWEIGYWGETRSDMDERYQGDDRAIQCEDPHCYLIKYGHHLSEH